VEHAQVACSRISTAQSDVAALEIRRISLEQQRIFRLSHFLDQGE
jgi:hypothetical protein